MSNFDLDCPRHDLFVSLAIKSFISEFGGEIVCADGRLPFPDHKVPHSPILLGYRPDAVIERETQYWLLEVKSYDDLYSPHSRKQYRILHDLLSNRGDFFSYFLIFDSNDQPVMVPEELGQHFDDGRIILAHT